MSDCATTPLLLWVAHLSTNKTFNFRKYIQRSLEDDFKVVVGIRLECIPLGVVSPTHLLALGTKLEIIVAKMALQLKDQHSVIKGAPVVQPNDNLFWFGHPHFVLTLIHYILFMMGTHFKSAVLEEETANVIRQWHAAVKDKRKKGKLSPSTRGEDSTSVWSRSNSPDISSHHRSPTLAEFASHHPEVTETATGDDDQIVPEDRRQARVNEVRIELPEITKAAS
ncbi:seven transmembrane MLO family protein [Actinidia rufa]|uniref:Seven transmembrane MLO family protein n=1 Tax=Actinidia rufa TaxID=165716 RepID=A0A7J0GQV8_9ERIC|nr:seven transmembrane MLO family protein [Actinidia rufa]